MIRILSMLSCTLKIFRDRWVFLAIVALSLFAAGETYSSVKSDAADQRAQTAALQAHVRSIDQRIDEQQKELEEQKQLKAIILQFQTDVNGRLDGMSGQINHLSDRIDRVFLNTSH